jgi:DsbC/DsbD-like thiol-disulfide interchange protein
MRFAIAGLLMMLPAALCGQELGQLDAPAVRAKSYVVYAAEEQSIAAGKRSVLELQFRVMDGFHVNSHAPKSELLIPTQISLQPADGVKMAAVEYPAGTSYSLSADPTEKLDVYTGAFTVRLPVTAAAGQHTLEGTLRYQACDRAACYPPKNLPVQVIFTAK